MLLRGCYLTVVLLIAGCGGDGPTSPPGPPQVAGTYTGPVEFSVSGTVVATGSARMDVVQAGAQVTISASLTLLGQTLHLPAVTGSINETGFVTAASGASETLSVDADCGVMRTGVGDISLTFSGNTARYIEQLHTDRCGTWTLSANLTRQ